jgi:sugar lactone lactonase YvrE
VNADVRHYRPPGAAALALLFMLGAVACGGSDDDPGSGAGTTQAGDDAPLVATAPCGGWQVETLAEGLGAVENALVLDDGTVLLSLAERGQVARLGDDGSVTPVVEGLTAPGGLASDGESAYVTTGLTVDATIGGVASGTIVRFDPATGEHETWATGLVSPNGLAILPDGDAVTTRTASGGATPAEVTRVSGDDPTEVDLLWSDVTGTNGAVAAPDGTAVYVTRSLADRAEAWRLPLDDPAAGEAVADLGAGPEVFLDDLAASDDGTLYAAAWAEGAAYRIDPDTGDACALADGLPGTTAVEVAADGRSLIATSQRGTVSALRPPA